MNKFKVIEIQQGYAKVRWIDSPHFEEHNLTEKSFVEENTMIAEGDFYCCVRNFNDKWKLSHVRRLDVTDDDVTTYNLTEELLSVTVKGKDPIGQLRKEAEKLKVLKGRHNPFFKSTKSVLVWLIEKNLRSASHG